jgi:hypothetical protein
MDLNLQCSHYVSGTSLKLRQFDKGSGIIYTTVVPDNDCAPSDGSQDTW